MSYVGNNFLPAPRQFALLTDEEIERFVPMVNEAFQEEPESHEGPSP
jgi:hypothetical protein